MRIVSVAAIAVLLTLNLPVVEAGIATVAIDFGSEWIKMGIVKPGTPMDIVLNRESKRKTANVVALRKGERTFGATALGTSVKYPQNGYRYLVELLGQKADSPVVERYRQQFPEHTIEADAERGTVVFRLDETTSYTVEELVAMILEHCNDLAAEYAEQLVSSHIIIVPPYFDQAARRALLSAADLAGLNVLRLMSSSIATGLNYGVFRRKEFNTTEQHIMFYDMGSTSTVATIGSFSLVKDKETKTKVPQFVVKGIGYDTTLGGFEWDQRLKAHMLDAFVKKNEGKLKGDPSTNARTLAKLLKEAQRIRGVLSANSDVYPQIEGLFEERDFKMQVSRDTLEALGEDLYPRVAVPVTTALQQAQLTMENISHFIVVGGGIRMPKVQAILKELNRGSDLTKNLNGDETFAMGGAYEAAALSKAFRVKKFITKDLNLKNIAMHTTRMVESEDGKTVAKPINAIVFGLNSTFPIRKTMKLNITEDFDFEVLYGGQSDDGMVLSKHSVFGVVNAFKSNDNSTFKGVKVRFELDLSGLVNISRIEAQFEGPEEPEEDSMLKKIGDSIGLGSLFGDGKKAEAADDDDAAESADETAETDAADETAEPEEKVEGANVTAETNTTADNTTANTTNTTNSSTPTKAEKQKDRTVRVVLAADVESNDLQSLSGATYEAAKLRMQTLKEAEERQRRTEAALNTLEGFIFATRDRLSQAEYEKVASEEERSTVTEKLTETSDWLEEDGWDAQFETLDAKLDVLNTSMKDIQYRVNELRARPQAIADLNQTLNLTRGFMAHMKNATANVSADELPWYTVKEIEELEKLYNETQTWLAEKVAEQADAPLTAAPVLKTSTLSNKNRKLSREMMYLVKKKPPIKPKKIKVPKNKTASANATKGDGNSTIDDTTSTEEPVVDEDPVEAPTSEDVDTEDVDTEDVDTEDVDATEDAQDATEDEVDESATKLDDEL